MNPKSVTTKTLAYLLILSLSVTFTFCGDESPEESTLFGYSIDGISKPVQSISGQIESQIQYDHEKLNLNLSISGSGSQMTINIANWDFQKPPKDGVIEREYDATFDTKKMN